MQFRKVLFIDLWESFYDRNPLYALTAILKRNNIQVDYTFSKHFIKNIEFAKEYKPDLVMYSAFSSQLDDFVKFDAMLKLAHPCQSMIGGPGLNDKYSHSIVYNSTIDYTCVGEGEIALEHFIKTGTPAFNIIPKDQLLAPQKYNLFANLDDLPLPDRSVVYHRDSLRKQMPSKQFLSGRGCPYKCTYCHNHLEHEVFKGSGKTVRLKSVDYLMEEIKDVQSKYPLKTIVFQDDIFFLNKKWGLEFSEKYPKHIGLPFTCNVRSNLIDEDVVRGLKNAGCTTVAWAIESGDNEMRNKLLKRNVTDENILNAAELFNKYGIMHRVNNVIGSPGESFEQILKTLELNIKTKPYMSSAHIFIPFQGLELTEYALKEGHLDPNKIQSLPKTFAEKTVLNFTETEKDNIKKMMYLFPILTRYPALYENKVVFKVLMNMPHWALYPFYQTVHLYFWSKMYRVSADLLTQLKIIRRYFSYGN
ncbi:B12-binding domain-containing radical SAM protein [bacterium]|nr:B12-binding domain-containing radical SAM protein [bacterium]